MLISTFYEKVRADELIGPIFNNIANVDWPQHLPIMYDFWESMLLDTGTYTRNAMEPHFRLNEKVRLLPEHFERWIHLFEAAVRQLFQGEKAELAITRARSVRGIMELKMGKINEDRRH